LVLKLDIVVGVIEEYRVHGRPVDAIPEGIIVPVVLIPVRATDLGIHLRRDV
jgi:hypothetical protein